MRLIDLTAKQRNQLAQAVEVHPIYLYQCAKGDRTPSPRVAKRLMAADNRLTWEDLYAHVKAED